ncbi:MAG: cytidylate kinase-like family protein [Tannerellaceae bacterium]|jgi:cytidylate kinase|nr:cytidylate kinase-like family protein [Tannerellaceae bacterium]
MEQYYAITIGRQLGSGGKFIGEQLSQRLNIPCYDKELIQLASQESGLEKTIFERVDEKDSYSFMGKYFGFRSGFMGYSESNYLCNETLFQIQSDVIRKIAERESAIFVGRCADYILREHPRCLKVFILSDPEERIARIMSDMKLSHADAATFISRIDKKRASYYNYYSQKVWGMATSYDFCFNASKAGFDSIVAMIEGYVRAKYMSAD